MDSGESVWKRDRHMRVRDLPLYCKPQFPDSSPIDLKPSNPHKFITTTRKFLSPYFSDVQTYWSRFADIVTTGKEHSLQTINVVRTNPNVLIRPCLIFLASSGAFIGSRGGVARKMLYGGFFGLTTTAVCYHEQTTRLTVRLYESLDSQFGYKPISVDRKIEEFDRNLGVTGEIEELDQNPSQSKVDEPMRRETGADTESDGDIGQSNPEDDDLYTTR